MMKPTSTHEKYNVLIMNHIFQIGVMNTGTQNGGVPLSAGKDTESFASHPYAPSQPETQINGAPNFSELFTVSNTRTQPVSQT